jgi:hypothetical protein
MTLFENRVETLREDASGVKTNRPQQTHRRRHKKRFQPREAGYWGDMSRSRWNLFMRRLGGMPLNPNSKKEARPS